MQRLTGAVGSIVGKARRTVRRRAVADERRQTFRREFGQYPSNFEASASERERVRREVVQPELAKRAQAVLQAEPGQGQRQAEAAFARAYQAAVELGLAEKGRTSTDYLRQQG